MTNHAIVMAPRRVREPQRTLERPDLALGVRLATTKAFLPEAEQVTKGKAAIRTLHTLVGTGVLASAVALAIGVWRPAGSGHGLASGDRQVAGWAGNDRRPDGRRSPEPRLSVHPGGTT